MRTKKLTVSQLKNQRELTPIIDNKPHVTFTTDMTSSLVLCPFCLHAGYLAAFETTLKSGKTSKKYTCPECKQSMRQESLTKNMTAEEYASWVFIYASYGFWRIVKYDTWKKRLNELGIAREFWDKYKALKAAAGPTYSDYMNQAGQEYADAWNRGENPGEGR